MEQSKGIKQYLDKAEVIILVLGLDEKVRLINRKGCEVLEYTESEIVGKNWFDHFIPKRLRKALRVTFKQVLSGDSGKSEFYENPVLDRSGEEKLIAWRNAIITNSDGAPIEILSTGEDVTFRRQTENALSESEATLRAILDTCVDGIITIDEAGKVLSFNPAAVGIFDYQPEEVIGSDVGILMPEPHRSKHAEYINHFLLTSEPRIINVGREVVGRRKGGSHFPLYLAVSDVNVRGKKMFAGIVRDLTDFKRMQEEIIQTQKLAAIGEMAASVGHEIKNPLAGISGAIEILKDTLDEEDSRRQVMDDILSEVRRLDNTVRDLLAFSKPWNPEPQSCDLKEIVERVARAFQEQEDLVKMRFIFGAAPKQNARVDPWLFEKVLWNLLDNASDAMKGEGRVRFGFEEGPGYVRLTVRDSGQGVPLELQKDVFRPFFTTKARGTGLGLAICKKIMDAHGGSISLARASGKGTKVVVQLPAGEKRAARFPRNSPRSH